MSTTAPSCAPSLGPALRWPGPRSAAAPPREGCVYLKVLWKRSRPPCVGLRFRRASQCPSPPSAAALPAAVRRPSAHMTRRRELGDGWRSGVGARVEGDGKCLGDNPAPSRRVCEMKAAWARRHRPNVQDLVGRLALAPRSAGGPSRHGNHRFKETIVAPEVAREKNCCQACLNDLEYGVPFHVRDHLMDALNEDVAPKSEVSREYHWAAKRQKQMDQVNGVGGGGERGTYETLREHVDELRQFAALDPGPIVRPRRDGPLTPLTRSIPNGCATCTKTTRVPVPRAPATTRRSPRCTLGRCRRPSRRRICCRTSSPTAA